MGSWVRAPGGSQPKGKARYLAGFFFLNHSSCVITGAFYIHYWISESGGGMLICLSSTRDVTSL